MKISTIKVINLATHPEYIKIVAKRYFDEWDKKGWRTLDSIIYRITHSLKKNTIPQTFLAVQGKNKPIWIVSLRFGDLTTRPDLSPWLSYLYVLPEYRKIGVWTILQKHILKTAKKLGYTYIYLCTKWEWYYERTGWKFIEKSPHRTGEKLNIYKYKL